MRKLVELEERLLLREQQETWLERLGRANEGVLPFLEAIQELSSRWFLFKSTLFPRVVKSVNFETGLLGLTFWLCHLPGL